MIRRRFVFTGRVQGVGFRATARHVARSYPITGWVRNEPDGSVTLEAQGESTEIQRFIDELTTTMARNIVSTAATNLDVVNHEEGFHITR